MSRAQKRQKNQAARLAADTAPIHYAYPPQFRPAKPSWRGKSVRPANTPPVSEIDLSLHAIECFKERVPGVVRTRNDVVQALRNGRVSRRPPRWLRASHPTDAAWWWLSFRLGDWEVAFPLSPNSATGRWGATTCMATSPTRGSRVQSRRPPREAPRLKHGDRAGADWSPNAFGTGPPAGEIPIG